MKTYIVHLHSGVKKTIMGQGITDALKCAGIAFAQVNFFIPR